MKKYMVLTDGGDGSICWNLYDTKEETDELLAVDDGMDEFGMPYYSVIEIDFDAQSLDEIYSCQ